MEEDLIQQQIQNEKQSYRDFVQRLTELKKQNDQYKDIFNIIIIGELQQNVRLKPDRRCEQNQIFIQLNRAIEFLGKISMIGVKKLEFELNMFDEKLDLSIMQSFLYNLQNLKDLSNIHVNEFIKKDKNPYTFLMFISYQPKYMNQSFTFTNFSNGRSIVFHCKINKNGVIKKCFEFNQSATLDVDNQVLNELVVFYQNVYEISEALGGILELQKGQNQNQQGNQNEQEKQKDEQENNNINNNNNNNSNNIKKSLSISYSMSSFSLTAQAESLLYLLKIHNNDKNIKSVSFVLGKYPNTPQNNLISDLSELSKLEIFKKLKLRIAGLKSAHMQFLNPFLNHIKGIDIKNYFQNASFNYQTLLFDPENTYVTDESKNINNNNNNNNKEPINFENNNFTTLKIFDFGSLNYYLTQQFEFAQIFPSLRKIEFICSQQIGRQSIIQDNIYHIQKNIETLKLFNFLRIFKTTPTHFHLNLQKINFNSVKFEILQDIILQVQRPLHLVIESFNNYFIHENKHIISKFLENIAFKTNIVSVSVCESIYNAYPEIMEIIFRIKRFSIQHIAYNQLIRPYMLYNPDIIYQDLFDFD